MKKILITTTALVASTTFAMADVDLSGNAEMGIFDDGDGNGNDVEFHTDIDVTFSLSGETDGGLMFGASIDLDESDDGDAFANDSQGGETIFVSGVFGTLTMGDTDGALDWALNEAIIGSAINDDHEHAGYNGGGVLDGIQDGGQVARYDYTFGDFAFGASLELDDTNDGITWGVGATYDGEFAGAQVGVGIGFQDAGGTGEAYGISVDVSLDNGFQAIASYTEFDVQNVFNADFTDNGVGALADIEVERHYGVAIGYEFGAFLIAANYGQFETDAGDLEGFGVVGNYDLGGGAELQGGYAHNDTPVGNFDTYSFGISMSF